MHGLAMSASVPPILQHELCQQAHALSFNSLGKCCARPCWTLNDICRCLHDYHARKLDADSCNMLCNFAGGPTHLFPPLLQHSLQ